MYRSWTSGLLGLLLVSAGLSIATAAHQVEKKEGKDGEFKVEGKLTDTDPKDTKTNAPSNVHKYKMKAGTSYVIRMKSTDVDSYLRLEDSTGKQLAEDDDGDGYPNAKMIFKCDADGEYKIICTCFPQEMQGLKLTGAYTLTVNVAGKDDVVPEKKKASGPKMPTYDHMYGKAAPEVLGDFCINGTAKKLSDLKGKVVLVDFWAIWCGPCIATFPHLRDLQKEYQKDGLEVLGVTTYYERFGFDKEEKKTVRAKEPLTAPEEHQMLRDFSKHHNLTYSLLVVPKDSYEKVSKEYSIVGIPTAVLVDRQGMVRLVTVGSGEENTQKLDKEIRHLLTEK